MVHQAEIVDRIVELIHTIVPAQDLDEARLPAIGCLVVSAVLVFWGARTIRAFIALACMTAGGYAGWIIAQHFGKPPPFGLVAGGVVAAVAGLALSRLWIAMLSGLLAGAIALAVVGYHQNLPERFEQFMRSQKQPAPTPENEFPLGEAGAAEAFGSQEPLQVVQRFAGGLDQADDPVVRNMFLWVAGASLIGTMVGSVAWRTAMIFWTSLAGMVLMVGAGGVLLSGTWPPWHEYVSRYAAVTGIALLVVWFGGIAVQWRGPRRAAGLVGSPAEPVAPTSRAT